MSDVIWQVIRSSWHAEHWIKVLRNTHDYQMLRSRFLALFLWPALLSSVRVAEAVNKNNTTSSVASLVGCGRLRTADEREDDSKPNSRWVSTWQYSRPPYRSVVSGIPFYFKNKIRKLTNLKLFRLYAFTNPADGCSACLSLCACVFARVVIIIIINRFV